MLASSPKEVLLLIEVAIAGMFSMVDELAASVTPTCAEAAWCCRLVSVDAFEDACELSEEAEDTCDGKFGKGATA